MKNLAIVRLYSGNSGQDGFYNMQELGLAKALVKYDFNIFIILPSVKRKRISIKRISKRISILDVPAKTITNHGFFNCNILLDYQIDIVHLLSDNQIYAPYVMNYCRRHQIYLYNYVGTLYSDTSNIIKRFVMNMFSKRNIKYYKKFLTLAKTPYVCDELKKEGINDVAVISVGLDLDMIPNITSSKAELRVKLNLPKDEKLIIFVGRLEKYKRPLNALHLINRLPKEYRMIIIGNGSMKDELLNMAREMSLLDRVIHLESVLNSEIHQYYKACDYFVNFNEKEIFGMSILESMYQGCTVIAIKAPGPNFIIEDYKSGYLVKSIEQMSIIIQEVNSDVSTEAHNRIINDFTWENSATKIIDCIGNIQLFI